MHKGWCIYFGYNDTTTHGYNCAKILFMSLNKKEIHTSYKNVATKAKLFNWHNYELSPDALKYENYNKWSLCFVHIVETLKAHI